MSFENITPVANIYESAEDIIEAKSVTIINAENAGRTICSRKLYIIKFEPESSRLRALCKTPMYVGERRSISIIVMGIRKPQKAALSVFAEPILSQSHWSPIIKKSPNENIYTNMSFAHDDVSEPSMFMYPC